MKEGVQQRSTRLILGIEDLPFGERLNRSAISGPEFRRRRDDLLQHYSILTEFVRVDAGLTFSKQGS